MSEHHAGGSSHHVPLTAGELLAELVDAPQSSAKELAERTGASPQVVGGLLGQMLRDGRVVRERIRGRGTRWSSAGPELRPQPPDPLEGREGLSRLMRSNRSPL